MRHLGPLTKEQDDDRMSPVAITGRRPAIGDVVQCRLFGEAHRYAPETVHDLWFNDGELIGFAVSGSSSGFRSIRMRFDCEGRDWFWPKVVT